MYTILSSRTGNGARGTGRVLFDSHYFVPTHVGELVNNFTRVTHTWVLPHAGGGGGTGTRMGMAVLRATPGHAQGRLRDQTLAGARPGTGTAKSPHAREGAQGHR